MSIFHERLKKARRNANITQKATAALLGVTDRGYQRWEAGEREPPYDSLILLAQTFNVSTDYLLGLTDDPTPPEKPKQ